MAHPEEISALTKAISGLGVDEKKLIDILAKWHPHHIHSYRKSNREIFHDDERQFHRWNEKHMQQLRQEFIRFKDAAVLRTMHPWERDARLFNEALQKDPRVDIIVETACTRSSEELLGARKAYHSLYNRSIEEEIATQTRKIEPELLAALVSAYRYGGPYVDEKAAKSQAQFLDKAVKSGFKKDEGKVVEMIVSTVSKSHLKAVDKFYKEISGKHLFEDLQGNPVLKQAIQCLIAPQAYFSKVLEAALKPEADEAGRDAVTRVIITRADVDLREIKEEFYKITNVTLAQKIAEVAGGNYRDLLVALVEKE